MASSEKLGTVPSVTELSDKVDAELREILGARELPLYEMMSHHLGWGSRHVGEEAPVRKERTHGVACLLAAAASGGELGSAALAAASVELVDNFAQIHDDIQSGRPARDGRDAVWWVWGPAQAINAGDGMHALARLSMFRLQERGIAPATTFRALQFLDEASLDLCEGRFQDLEAQERFDLGPDGHLAMAKQKTGALIACAMKVGALVASADEAVVDAMGACGSRLGVATQVLDDIEQIWPANQDRLVEEALNKKKLLPVVLAIERGTANQKRRLGELYMKRVLEPADLPAVRGILEEIGVRDACEAMAQDYGREAAEALNVPGLEEGGAEALRGFIASRLERGRAKAA